jgi:hypothetical protein
MPWDMDVVEQLQVAGWTDIRKCSLLGSFMHLSPSSQTDEADHRLSAGYAAIHPASVRH